MDESAVNPRRSSTGAAYRVFLVASDDSVQTSLPLAAADDAEAKALALAMVDVHAVELWDGVRFVERFDRA